MTFAHIFFASINLCDKLRLYFQYTSRIKVFSFTNINKYYVFRRKYYVLKIYFISAIKSSI
jgi:hypothetical protein